MTNCWRRGRCTPISMIPRLCAGVGPRVSLNDFVIVSQSAKEATTLQLCRWLAPYAWRRRFELAIVGVTVLLRIGLDLLKPWPMVFLVDYVLRGKNASPLLTRLADALPGSATPVHLIGWSVGATVLIFLFSWAVGV